MIDCARDGSWDQLYKELEAHGELVNVRPLPREYTVLHQAVFHGEEEVVNTLIGKFRADPDVLSKYGEKAVDVAKARGHKNLVKSLKKLASQTEVGADGEADDFDLVQMPDGSWKVVSHESAATGEAAAPSGPACVASVVAPVFPGGITPVPTLTQEVTKASHVLIDLAKKGSWEEIFSELDKHRELVNVRPALREYSVLQQAAWLGHEDAVTVLMEKYGADPEQHTKLGKSSAEVAEGQGHHKLAKAISMRVKSA